MGPVQQVAPRRLEWLRGEVARWQADGLVDEATGAAISARYTADRRLSLGRLLLLLGGAFVGVGILWLVAANLDQLSPLARFVGITAAWLGGVALAETLASRAGRGGRVGQVAQGSAAVGAARLAATLAYGGVVFQAAQSLQVPAYESGLIGVWAAGALAYAYAVAAVLPLLVGVAAGTGWYGWVVGERADNAAAAALALLIAGALATAIAVVHDERWRPGFASPWRQAGALFALAGLFVAALPGTGRVDAAVPVIGWTGVVTALLCCSGAATLAGRRGRVEALVAAAVLLVGLPLLLWTPSEPAPGLGSVTGEVLARAVVGTALYVLVAGWFAGVGVMRDAEHLTGLATVALVVFVTVQSFAVFEPLLSGAALFLVLGVIFLGSGLLANYGRRRLVSTTAEAGS